MLFERVLNHPWNTPCYAQMKFLYPEILQSKFEVITPKGYVVILISFNFWGRSVNWWSVFCSFIDWLYLWNKAFLRYSFYIISDSHKNFFLIMPKLFKFSKVEFLLTVKVMTSGFGVQRLIQKCHPWFFNSRTNKYYQKFSAFDIWT